MDLSQILMNICGHQIFMAFPVSKDEGFGTPVVNHRLAEYL